MKRLLYIAHRTPYPPTKGERVRALHEIQALSGSFRVTLAAPAHSPGDLQAAEPLQQWCESVILAPAGRGIGLLRGAACLLGGRSVTEGFFRNRRLEARLGEEARREPFDVVFAYSSGMLPAALAVPARSRVTDLVDVDSAKWAAYAHEAPWPKSWLYALEARGVRRLERRSLDQCDAVLLVSPEEVRALGVRSEKVLAIGNGVDTDYFAPGAAGEADLPRPFLVFTGSMDYRPNVEAVCWFVREVWPPLRRELSGLHFVIVGRDPAKAVRQLAETPGVLVTGSVPDVRPYLAAAAAAVAPLRIARGVQNKILEAMAMGKAVIASSAALEGLELAVGRHALRADGPGEWVECILALMRDAQTSQTLGRAARACALESFNWTARMRPLVDLCERLCAEPARHRFDPGAPGVAAGPGASGSASAVEGCPK